MAPGDVVRVQNIIALVNSELRDGESEESAAKRVLEMATSKPAAAPETMAGAPEAKLGAVEEKTVAPSSSPLSGDAKSDAVAPPASSDTSVRAFLEPLGLGQFAPHFEKHMLGMPILRASSAEELRVDLAEMGLPIGARRVIIKALEEHATAAKKEAELKAVNADMLAVAVRKEHDSQRMEEQRKQIEQLKDVIAKRKKPVQIVCPISHDVMLDPVVAADGHTYERAQIEMWLTDHTTSPMTGADLEHTTLTVNIIARGMVQDFIDECHAAGTDPNEAL